MHISDQQLPENPSLEIHPDVLLQRPQLAAFFGPIVATWADIEGRLEAIFLLSTGDDVALARLRDIKGWDGRAKFFVEHVQEQQGDQLAIELRAILRFSAKPAAKRHDLAHGIWALCKELPEDLVVASPGLYTGAMREALRAQAEGTAQLLIDNSVTFQSARVVTQAHLQMLLDELREARSLLHTFMIEKMPAIVHVSQREALPRAADHPDVAARIRNARVGIKKRDKTRRSAS